MLVTSSKLKTHLSISNLNPHCLIIVLAMAFYGIYREFRNLPTECTLILVPFRFARIDALGIACAPGQQIDVARHDYGSHIVIGRSAQLVGSEQLQEWWPSVGELVRHLLARAQTQSAAHMFSVGARQRRQIGRNGRYEAILEVVEHRDRL